MSETESEYGSPAPSPLRRALRMTLVFVGPAMLGLFLLGAFFGALSPLPGALQLLKSDMPGSLVISMNTGAKASSRTYLVLPESFKQKTMFRVRLGMDDTNATILTVTPSSSRAFFIWCGVMTAAVALTLFVSIPALWRLFGPRDELATNADEDV